MNSGSQSIVRNSLFGLSTWLLPLLLTFVATPIIVFSLGNKEYGIYALVLGFVGYSFNFGVGRSITKYIAQYRADGTPEKATKIISATLTLNVLVGVVGGAIIMLLANWMVSQVFVIEEADRERAVLAFYLAGLIIFMTMMSQVGNSVLQGVHRFDVYSKLFNINSIGIIAGNVVLAFWGYGMLWLLGWNLFALSLTSVAGIYYAKKIVPEFKLKLDVSKAAISSSLGFSVWIVGYQILGNILLLFERGWIMRKLGPEALTYYVVPLTVGFYIHNFITSIMLVLFPLASEQKDDRPRLEKLYRKATKITCLIIFFIVVSLVVQSRVFLEVWMGPEFAANSTVLLVIHTISFGCLALLIVAWQLADGIGHPRYNFFVLLVCIGISLTGMIVTVDSMANRGIALSRLAGFGIMLISIVYSEHWIFGKFNLRFWAKLLAALVPASAATAFVQYLLVSGLSASWLLLVGTTLLGGMIYLGLLILFGFVSDDEKSLIRRMLRA